MKKVLKPSSPNCLTKFAQEYPDAGWDKVDGDFTRYKNGADFAALRSEIFQSQGQLCAYCEGKIEGDNVILLQRIEHFRSKRDKTDPDKNWALDWNNIFGVCKGGDGSENKHAKSNKPVYRLPENLSCDAFKERQIKNGALSCGDFKEGLVDENERKGLHVACEGLIIHPVQLPAFPCLFKLKKRTGELEPDFASCEQIVIVDNCYDSVAELVQKTITHLNLNCYRLNEKRLVVLREYEKLVKGARSAGNSQINQQLAERWFRNRWPGFFTTRRILLKHHAENYLKSIDYDG